MYDHPINKLITLCYQKLNEIFNYEYTDVIYFEISVFNLWLVITSLLLVYYVVWIHLSSNIFCQLPSVTRKSHYKFYNPFRQNINNITCLYVYKIISKIYIFVYACVCVHTQQTLKKSSSELRYDFTKLTFIFESYGLFCTTFVSLQPFLKIKQKACKDKFYKGLYT